MLNAVQAATSGHTQTAPRGYCASCGQRPAAPGWLMCHECRAACDLSEQVPLFPTVERRYCLDCGCDITERHWSAKRCHDCVTIQHRNKVGGARRKKRKKETGHLHAHRSGKREPV